MPVLLDHRLLFAFPARLVVCHRSTHGALMERAVVHRRSFALLWFTRFFLRLLPLFYDLCMLGGKYIYIFAHVLRSADCCLHYLMSSLKITVCASRLIPFEIIIVLDLVWPPALEKSLPFCNWSISWARVLAGLCYPIIFTVFSSRFISSITP